jgi:hypothetical protein
MGILISRRRFLSQKQHNLTHPIIFCCEIDGFTDGAVSLSNPLARRLIELPAASRGRRLEDCFVGCLEDLPDSIVIRDFDALFNPAYQVDVVALLLSAYRRHRFDAVWPGTLDGEDLVYAEEGYRDYRRFGTDHYDLTCIY